MMYTDLPKRKPNRLKEYDYSSPGAYFITICTNDRRNLFWENVGASIARPLLAGGAIRVENGGYLFCGISTGEISGYLYCTRALF